MIDRVSEVLRFEVQGTGDADGEAFYFNAKLWISSRSPADATTGEMARSLLARRSLWGMYGFTVCT